VLGDLSIAGFHLSAAIGRARGLRVRVARSVFMWALIAVMAAPTLLTANAAAIGSHRPVVAREAAVSKVAAKPVRNAPGWGYDISWPQCSKGYPQGTFDFATIGVTGGRPYTGNPCLADEVSWATAAQSGVPPHVYVNLDLDGAATGRRDCQPDDHPCRAFNHGVNTAADAVSYATSQGVRATYWWLDVELGNLWSDVNLDWNAAVVAGAIDEMQRRGVRVGIYSTSLQWRLITGDYRPAVPSWPAVYGDQAAAPASCDPASAFTAGPVLMVQYSGTGFDRDYVCPAGSQAFVEAMAPAVAYAGAGPPAE
jgi:hypothetical protein